MKKKVLALLMLSVMIFTLFACNNTNSNESSTGSGNDTSQSSFPLETKDWGGVEIKVLTHAAREYNTCEIAALELNDEPVNDAFYNRNSYIEQNYGIKIVAEYIEDNNQSKITTTIRENQTAGLDEYQAVSAGIVYLSTLGTEGYLYDIKSIENGYINTAQPWWDQAIMRDLTMNGKVWFLSGDAIVTDDEATWGIFFNKDLVSEYNLEDPYQLVRDKKWTLEKMYEMIKKVHLMNGSSMSFDPSVGDVWGMVTQSYDAYALMLGCGQKMVVNGADDIYLRVKEERNITAFGRVMEILQDRINVGMADFYGRWDSGVYGQETQIFTNGNALFMPSALSMVSNEEMRTAEIHYGILPMPLLDEMQDEYTSSSTVYWGTCLSIPTSNIEKLDATCYALEAMAYWGKEMVTPEFYERTLQYKRFQDDESAEMLDLIFRNRTYDLGAIFDFGNSSGGSGALYFYTSLLTGGEIISFYESKQSAMQTDIDALKDRIKMEQ